MHKILPDTSLLSRDEQDTSHKLYTWQSSSAGYLTPVSTPCLSLAAIMCFKSSSMKLGPGPNLTRLWFFNQFELRVPGLHGNQARQNTTKPCTCLRFTNLAAPGLINSMAIFPAQSVHYISVIGVNFPVRYCWQTLTLQYILATSYICSRTVSK